jgi:hypothetical protein
LRYGHVVCATLVLLRRLKDFILKNPLHTPRLPRPPRLQSCPHASFEQGGPLAQGPATPASLFGGWLPDPNLGILKGSHPLSRRRQPLEPCVTTMSSVPHPFCSAGLRISSLRILFIRHVSHDLHGCNHAHTPALSRAVHSPKARQRLYPFLGAGFQTQTSGFLRGRTP